MNVLESKIDKEMLREAKIIVNTRIISDFISHGMPR